MYKFLRFSLILVLFLLASFPVAAAPKSLGVTIEVDTLFEGGVTYPSPFIAYGPAVDAGLICAKGTVYDMWAVVAGPPDFAKQNFHMLKQFVCEGDSDYFVINLTAHVNFDPYKDTGEWNMLKGTGAYEMLHGQGTLVGTPTDTGVFDVYTGWVNN